LIKIVHIRNRAFQCFCDSVVWNVKPPVALGSIGDDRPHAGTPGQEWMPMLIRRFILGVLLAALSASVAAAGEPVVKGSFHTILILGQNCLTVPDTETYLLPGARLQFRACEKRPQQVFDWNVVTFEIKYRGLCMDAFRPGDGKTKAGDAVGLWYCNQTPHQKWYPNHSNESWLEAFNIVGGGSPSSELCLSIAGEKSIDGAPLTVEKCDGGDRQWFRMYPWPPLQGEPVSQLNNTISLLTILTKSVAPKPAPRR
jgi:hypothetical protein